jgi:poly(3-hydroxyalkanoate) depolymerase
MAVFTVSVSGQRLNVAVRTPRGGGAQPALLLMNGIGARLEVLEPFVDALDRGIGVIRFDVPGVGSSPVPFLPYRLWCLAIVVRRLLDALGQPRVDVLGMSWGGALAQQFAVQYRSRCRRLVLVSTSVGALMVPGRAGVVARLATPRRYTDPDYMAAIAAEIYGGTIDPVTARGFAEEARSESRRGYYYQLLAGAGWTSLPWLWSLRQRTLIVAGDADPLVPLQNAHLLHRLIPRSALHVFHGGHLGLVMQASELAPVIGRFLMCE